MNDHEKIVLYSGVPRSVQKSLPLGSGFDMGVPAQDVIFDNISRFVVQQLLVVASPFLDSIVMSCFIYCDILVRF